MVCVGSSHNPEQSGMRAEFMGILQSTRTHQIQGVVKTWEAFSLGSQNEHAAAALQHWLARLAVGIMVVRAARVLTGQYCRISGR